MTRMSGGQKTVISWQDAPDDLFFRSTPTAKKVRHTLVIFIDTKLISSLFVDKETDDGIRYQADCEETLQENPVKSAWTVKF